MKTVLALSIAKTMVACAMTGTQQMSAAKIIARNAGYYVALNNPGASVAIAEAYKQIEQYKGASYKASFTAGLRWLLKQDNIQGSDRLAQDAADLLNLFGVPVPEPAKVDLTWVDQFDESDLRLVAEAFFDGMNQ